MMTKAGTAAVLLAALAQALPAAAYTESTDPAARAAIDQAKADMTAGKIQASVNTLLEVIKTDKHSSEAPRQLAIYFYNMAVGDDTHLAVYFRRQAETFANKALRIDDEDRDAADVRDRATGKRELVLRWVTYPARPQSDAADALFDGGQWRAAIAKYEEAASIDTRCATLHLNIGQAHLRLGDTASAERAFRKAVATEPNLEDAWLELSNLLRKQKRVEESEAAAMGAVTARPNSPKGWFGVRAAQIRKGATPRFFIYKPKGSYSVRQKKIFVDSGQAPVDEAAWTVVAEAQRSVVEADPTLGRAAIQIATWDKALRTIAATEKVTPVTDPTLRDMLAFHQGGQLKAAVFALLFQDAYRDEYEAWKKAEPDGLQRFIDIFHTSI
jgi:tetratricopeptide (TPR) repeat protein